MLKKLLAVSAVAVLLSACSTQTFMVGQQTGRASLKLDDMQTFFVNGIGQTQTVNAARICGGSSKVAKVEVQQTFVNGLLGSLTGGIYSPRQARVFCYN